MGDSLDTSTGSDASERPQISLAQMTRGSSGTVCSISLSESEAQVLWPMGLREKASIRVCRPGEPCIVEVGCAPGMCRRIGVSRHVAQRVMVAIEQ